MNIDLERLKIHWRGEYSATITYKEGEIIFYKGSCFAAKAENIGVEPIEGRDWELVAPTSIPLREKGDLLFHNGNEVIRLPIGEEKQGLQLVSGVPSWSSAEVTGFLPVPETFANLPNLAYKLATMGYNTSGGYKTYLMADGTIKAVGSGGHFRNGDPNDSVVYIPSRVNAENNETRFKKLFSGHMSNYAIDTEDNVWSWGYNNEGQLGHGNTTNIAIAKRIEYFVVNNIKIKSIVCGNFAPYNFEYCAFFLTTDGRVYACGYNAKGRLGDGTIIQRTTPVHIPRLENIVNIYASVASIAMYAIDSIGDLWVWGSNAQGQLGNGGTGYNTFPIKSTEFSSVKKVVAGNGVFDSSSPYTSNRGYALAIQEDGTLWSTGYNGYGNLGLGDTGQRYSWTRSPTSVKFKDIACNGSAVPSCAAIATDNRLYVWGGNVNGQLGDGTTTQKNSPTVSTYEYATGVTKILFGGYSDYDGAWHYQDAFYFQSGNAIYAAGYGSYGNLGTGSTAATNSTFAPVTGISGTIKDWAVYGTGSAYGLSVLMEDGSVYAGGYNGSGETGTHRTSTSTVITLKKVIF